MCHQTFNDEEELSRKMIPNLLNQQKTKCRKNKYLKKEIENKQI
jgi:hypothetical protein